jgi:predicted ABC-class ATPase
MILKSLVAKDARGAMDVAIAVQVMIEAATGLVLVELRLRPGGGLL